MTKNKFSNIFFDILSTKLYIVCNACSLSVSHIHATLDVEILTFPRNSQINTTFARCSTEILVISVIIYNARCCL